MSESESSRAHLIIRGRVQGVWFRDSTRTKARELGLSGWVRNLPDGSVEAVAEGPRVIIEKLVGWLHRGPPLARVSGVEIDWETPRGGLAGFDITR